MTRRVAHRTFSFVMLALLLAPPAPSRALAQEGPPAAGGPGDEAVALTLDECLKASLENNLDIAVRRYDPLKSESLVTVQSSVFDPLITGNTSSQQSQRLLTFFAGAPLSTDKTHNSSVAFEDPLVMGGRYRFQVGATDNRNLTGRGAPNTTFETTWQLTFTQPLLRNMGPDANRWQIVVARNNLGVSESQFRQTVMNALSDAEKAYWDLNFALMDLKTKQGSLQLAKDFLEQNRIKVRVGTLAPIEITQAEAGVADREEGVILAENAVRTAEDALRRIMNVPPESPMWSRPIRPADPPPLDEVTPVMPEAVTTSQANRPDLEQARLNLKSRETEMVHRRNQRRWGLDFQGAYGALGVGFDQFKIDPVTKDPITDPLTGLPIIDSNGSYGDSLEDLRERNQDNWSLSLNLTVPIGNRQAVASFTNAEYALQQARYDLQRLEQAARIEVRNAVRTVETNLKRVKAAQVNTRLQREKLEAEQKKFENGMSTSFQVLQFQTDLSSAETRENQAIIDFNKSRVELERVKGTLLQSKKIVVPGATGPGADGREASAALRGLWRFGTDAPPPATGEATDGNRIDRVPLPTGFVFRGRRLLGVDGSGEPEGGAAGGR